MQRYLALLGSINVGGNRLKMADLREALEREDFAGVETVVASGNVLFDHEARPSSGLAEKIAWVVEDRFGIDSFVVVRSREELAAAIAGNPFAGENEDKFILTAFLAEPLDRAAFEAFAAGYDGPERLAAGEREFFVDFGSGVGESRLPQRMRHLRLENTMRNLSSLRRILEKMKA